MEQIRRNFYPRPPRGGRPARTTATSRQMRFLSTPSARRATTNRSLEVVTAQFLSTPSARRATSPRSFGGRIWIISIHALREEGDTPAISWRKRGKISIHALREEGDLVQVGAPQRHNGFLSTPSARRATKFLGGVCADSQDFYPRPPRGGRHYRLVRLAKFDEFLSTPSARRATTQQDTPQKRYTISIHALREEGDSKNRDKISIFKQIIQHSARI